MANIIILSQASDAPNLASRDVADDGNLTAQGFTKIHTQLAYATAAHQSGYAAVEICTSVAALVTSVARLHGRLGAIELLDIVGHGAPGLQQIGSEVLFEANDTALLKGGELPDQLRPYLAPYAKLRLLGCNTGREQAGRCLLRRLDLLFPRDVTVYGTIDRVDPEHFKTGQFSQVRELLFSSEAAIDGLAPDAGARRANLVGSRPAPA